MFWWGFFIIFVEINVMAKICKHSEGQSCQTDSPIKNRISKLLSSVRLYFLALVGTRFLFLIQVAFLAFVMSVCYGLGAYISVTLFCK